MFVKRVDLHGVTYEEVYETAHLEIVPPAQKTGVADLASYEEDGLWRITDLNTGKFLLVYNDRNHWNHNLREEFFQKVTFVIIKDSQHVGQVILWLQQSRTIGNQQKMERTGRLWICPRKVARILIVNRWTSI